MRDSHRVLLLLHLAVALLTTRIVCTSAEDVKLVSQYLVYYVNPGEDFDVHLRGFTLPRVNPKKFDYTILETVSHGNLYFPSYNYCKYKHQPSKRGSLVTGAADAPCPRPSFLYHYPSDRVLPKGELDRFRFITRSRKYGDSCAGVVHFVDASNPLLVSSTFDMNAESWTVVHNKGHGGSDQAIWDRSSIGADINRYVHGTEGWIDLNAHKSDKVLWFFSAPSKFLGNHVRGGMAGAYNGILRFVLSSASGDFRSSNLNHGHDGTSDSLPVVRIECDRCRNEGPERTDRGIQLVFPLSALSLPFDGSTRTIQIRLRENSGWLKDSENSQIEWTPPTQNEFVQVLKRFSALKILGDYTKHHESILLDSVRLEPGPPGSVLPESSHEFMHFEDSCTS